jgi:hypothetical protein
MQKDMNRSVDDTIRSIDYGQIKTPTAQAEFLQAQQRRLYGELGRATDAEEVNRIMQEIMGNGSALYDLLGNTPDAAKLYKQQLEDARKLANERYAIFHDNAQKMIDDTYALVRDVLQKLRDGLAEVLPLPGTPPPDPLPAPGGGVPPPGTGDNNSVALSALGVAAVESTTRLTGTNGFVPSIGSATQNLVSFAAAAAAAASAIQQVAQQNVHVHMDAPRVEVTVAGTAEPLIDMVSARISAGVMQKMYSASASYSRRAAMSGRG